MFGAMLRINNSVWHQLKQSTDRVIVISCVWVDFTLICKCWKTTYYSQNPTSRIKHFTNHAISILMIHEKWIDTQNCFNHLKVLCSPKTEWEQRIFSSHASCGWRGTSVVRSCNWLGNMSQVQDWRNTQGLCCYAVSHRTVFFPGPLHFARWPRSAVVNWDSTRVQRVPQVGHPMSVWTSGLIMEAFREPQPT